MVSREEFLKWVRMNTDIHEVFAGMIYAEFLTPPPASTSTVSEEELIKAALEHSAADSTYCNPPSFVCPSGDEPAEKENIAFRSFKSGARFALTRQAVPSDVVEALEFYANGGGLFCEDDDDLSQLDDGSIREGKRARAALAKMRGK